MSKKPNNTQEPKNKRKQAHNYIKYSGMAFQMGAIILVGTLIGQKLDSYLAAEMPYLTILFAILSIFAALYVSLKDLIKKN